MNPRKLFNVIVVSLIMSGVGVGFQVAAQDVTPTPETTEVAPAPTVAPVEPPVVVEPPAPAPSPFTPEVVMTLVVIAALVAVIVSQNSTIKTGLVQLGASAPAFGYAGVKTGAVEGIATLERIAGATETKLDDAAVAEIKRIMLEVFAEIDAKRGMVNSVSMHG